MAKILIVDDEPDLRYMLRKLLEKAGHKVVEAGFGEEGFVVLKILKKDKPDLIILDIMMPGMDGWELCKKIKSDENFREIPVVMFTVKTSKKDIEKSMKLGADTHLKKPFIKEEILGTIERLLEKTDAS